MTIALNGDSPSSRESKISEGKNVARAELRRACRKSEAVPDTPWSCNVCGRVLLSKAGLVNHMKTHQPRSTSTRIVPPASVPATSTVCDVCGKVCKSPGGLKRHMKTHGDVIPPAATPESSLTCNICSLHCRSLAGLKSHLRMHDRAETNEIGSNNDVEEHNDDDDEGMANV